MTTGQTGSPTPCVAVFRFPADPAASPLARHFVRGVLGEWRLAQAADVAELLTSELVGNAIEACAAAGGYDGRLVGCVEVGLTAEHGRLLIEVADADPRPPRPRTPGLDDEGGRGLMLVEGLAERWGHHPATTNGGPGHGKVVWFEIALVAAVAPAGLPIRLPRPRTAPEPDRPAGLPDLALLGRVRRCLDLV
ncbi:ATP-binding protein [Pseudofrankia sp. DC12]|uniref:ATP-binding protein n=1 Tax=Pseudofrankia sp. DC12 TaxID=683315 RepID=UPI000695E582|nr:ATP-binding protein [Pseudofrankia sp. DC12]